MNIRDNIVAAAKELDDLPDEMVSFVPGKGLLAGVNDASITLPVEQIVQASAVTMQPQGVSLSGASEAATSPMAAALAGAEGLSPLPNLATMLKAIITFLREQVLDSRRAHQCSTS